MFGFDSVRVKDSRAIVQLPYARSVGNAAKAKKMPPKRKQARELLEVSLRQTHGATARLDRVQTGARHSDVFGGKQVGPRCVRDA